MKKLDGKVALVTGSGRGIGQAIALKLAREGAKVVLNDIDEAPAAETVAAIKALGSDAIAVVGDVTAKDFGDRFIKAALEGFGRIDIIVNNAGYAWDSVIQKMSDEQWYAMIDVHATAPFRVLRAAADYIKNAAKAEKEAGQFVARKVVNVTSMGGICGNPGQIAYSAGKSAVVGMTRTMAKEWGRYGVNVNCVAFGWIKTRMTAPAGSGESSAVIAGREIKMGVNPELLDTMARQIPLGRGGTPEEAAGSVYLLCLPEADYITGEMVMVSGGFNM
ncbi:SDR family NAD(P)-dependent oxidoreductase [Magnetospirillum sp. SS-4]|uniref:SDR family NAD(P)-dependent oxidoreductase n=1 Tax=Magnetospirillum sp. SS-4 TaxID=2681465 RepID=UPI00137E35A6|nr:SDR family oxidoreductase [Magnetospirillum sp. SS-4]CAA7612259.1 3-oxoacyl-(acyl-carrier-protein) reductase 1 [Magnetospirillum sp. SS-4]